MVDRPTRTANGGEPRGDDVAEWEVFVRSDRDDRLRHVGSVSAPTPEAAHEYAGRLFSWYATDVWVCPAAAVHRFSDHELGETANSEGVTPDEQELVDQPVTDEGTDVPVDSDADRDDENVEPRVREL
ncbi:Htur_1727 family rSAM-partnered candidate RiPP [Haloparvum sp. PAK95]|uniref:Htur_1727 family rSAM-partnered candidate RiPP n=1 Tax=Haloparvum sp. PAK95 TaxID=3418962 RepID=UPI003D2F2502